uniref:Uncharacterized protein n=1 Tax=Nelumbo nucifera TaxID=4432 RepID=A0A822Y3E2_NELNU|nr:TPA_asm: hypothetical protein HUJ06_028250 [Nelumbo nucifera]
MSCSRGAGSCSYFIHALFALTDQHRSRVASLSYSREQATVATWLPKIKNQVQARPFHEHISFRYKYFLLFGIFLSIFLSKRGATCCFVFEGHCLRQSGS